MGSPGGGWEGRRREGSGCFLVFSALASHDCRVCRVHPAHKLGLPASPAASSHLCENLRRHLSFLHGILLTATPRLDGTKGHPREGWGTGGRAATLDRHPGERQAVTSSLPPTRQSLPLLVHHLSGWRGACPTPAGLPGEVTENKTNAGAERGDRESAVWRDRAHARLAEAKKTQPGEAPAPRLRPSSQSRRRRLEEKGRRRAARSRATTCCQGPTTGGTRLTSAGPSRPGSCARGGPCAHAHPTRASIRPAGRRGDVKGPVTREGRLAPGRDGHSQLRWVISLTRPVGGGGKRPGERGHCPESGEERSHLRAVAGAGLQQSDATCRCAHSEERATPKGEDCKRRRPATGPRGRSGRVPGSGRVPRSNRLSRSCRASGAAKPLRTRCLTEAWRPRGARPGCADASPRPAFASLKWARDTCRSV